MARSVLRMAKADKHLRLFELIRQGNLSDQATQRATAPRATDAAKVQAFRQQAHQSLSPEFQIRRTG